MTRPRACTAVTSTVTLILFLGPAPPAAAQQRVLDHKDVLQWKTIDDPALSPDGDWLAFALTLMEGDPALTLKAATGDGPALTVRGTSPTFTSDSRYLVFAVPPPESEVDALKREGKEEDDLPKDALAVADIAGVFEGAEAQLAGVTDLGPVESYEVAREESWLAYVPVEEDDADAAEAGASTEAEGSADESDADDQEGGRLHAGPPEPGDEPRDTLRAG